jgi:hypothetical protein
MGLREGFHDEVPDAGRSPTNKAIVAGCVRPKALRQIAPRCARTQYPKNAAEARRSLTLATPRDFFVRNGQKRFNRLAIASDLPRQADHFSVRRHVSKVPTGDIRKMKEAAN